MYWYEWITFSNKFEEMLKSFSESEIYSIMISRISWKTKVWFLLSHEIFMWPLEFDTGFGEGYDFFTSDLYV